MPDTRKPLGETIVDGVAGLIYDDPITLWGSALSVLLTWILVELDVVSGVWVGVALGIFVWLAIALSLRRAVARHHV